MVLAVASEKDTLRTKTLDVARRHKASWIELGQYLFTIHKDKHYKNWGYLTFETYCMKELGLRQTTASKLLRSYAFLEKEEPRMADAAYQQEEAPKTVPNYESVNLLRLAKDNPRIAPPDFADLRQAVLTHAKEPKEVRAQVQKIMEKTEPKETDEMRQSKRNAALRRLVTLLTNTKKEMEADGLLPAFLIKQIADLSSKLQDQIEA